MRATDGQSPLVAFTDVSGPNGSVIFAERTTVNPQLGRTLLGWDTLYPDLPGTRAANEGRHDGPCSR